MSDTQFIGKMEKQQKGHTEEKAGNMIHSSEPFRTESFSINNFFHEMKSSEAYRSRPFL